MKTQIIEEKKEIEEAERPPDGDDSQNKEQAVEQMQENIKDRLSLKIKKLMRKNTISSPLFPNKNENEPK